MAILCCCEEYLAVAAASEVFIVRRYLESSFSSDPSRPWPIVLSAMVSIDETNQDNSSDCSDDGKAKRRKVSEPTKQDIQILAAGFARSGRLLAICNNRKQLIVWRECENSWKLDMQRNLEKQATALTIPSNETSILVADRYGQVSEFKIGNSSTIGDSVLLGHVSTLLDLCLSSDERYLLTADRDEKIRVSRYPKCYDIQSFCFGHTEYVRSLCLCPGLSEVDVPNGILASGGGDGILRLWRFVDGLELGRFDFNEDVSTESDGTRRKNKRIRKIVCTSQAIGIKAESLQLALLFEGDTSVTFMDVIGGDYVIQETSVWSNDNEIVDISNVNNRLYLLMRNPTSDSTLVELESTSACSCIVLHSIAVDSLNKCERLNQRLSEAKEELPPLEKDVQYDNVSDYMARKKARIRDRSKGTKDTYMDG